MAIPRREVASTSARSALTGNTFAGNSFAGNASAEALIKHEGGLRRYIQRQVPSTEDAEDILQDVYYQFLTNLDVEGSIERTAAWLYRVARNRVIDWYRKKRPRAMSTIAEEERPDPAIRRSEQPDGELTNTLFWEAFNAALAEMPEKNREVWLLHEAEGKSFNEIVEITGVPLNTLLSRKRYAALFLRKSLKEFYDEL